MAERTARLFEAEGLGEFGGRAGDWWGAVCGDLVRFTVLPLSACNTASGEIAAKLLEADIAGDLVDLGTLLSEEP